MSNDPSIFPGNSHQESPRTFYHHKIKASVESLYSSVLAESFSLSSSYKESSSESVDVDRVLKKSSEIKEMVTARLTAFMYMSKLCLDEENFVQGNRELEKIKKSLDITLKSCIEEQDKTNEIFIKGILEKISQLQKEFSKLQMKLLETQEEIRNTEEEEVELKDKMLKVEGNINRFIIETKEENQVSCNCLLM
jgi:hypothetical protein